MVCGGFDNRALAVDSAILGGEINTTNGERSAICAGKNGVTQGKAKWSVVLAGQNVETEVPFGIK